MGPFYGCYKGFSLYIIELGANVYSDVETRYKERVYISPDLAIGAIGPTYKGAQLRRPQLATLIRNVFFLLC